MLDPDFVVWFVPLRLESHIRIVFVLELAPCLLTILRHRFPSIHVHSADCRFPETPSETVLWIFWSESPLIDECLIVVLLHLVGGASCFSTRLSCSQKGKFGLFFLFFGFSGLLCLLSIEIFLLLFHCVHLCFHGSLVICKLLSHHLLMLSLDCFGLISLSLLLLC
jgi:hypothetical protein